MYDVGKPTTLQVHHTYMHYFVHFFAIFNFKDFNDMKISHFMIYGELKQATTDFSFGFLT